MHLVFLDPRVRRGHRRFVVADAHPISRAALFVLGVAAAACGGERLANEGKAGTVITSDPTTPASSDDPSDTGDTGEGAATGNAMLPGELPVAPSSSGGSAPDERATSTEAGAGPRDAAGPVDAGGDGALCNSVWLSDWQEVGPVQRNTCLVVPPNNSGLKPPGSACQSSFDCAQECCDCMPGHGQYVALCQCGTCVSNLCGRSFNDPVNGTLTTCRP